MLENNVYCGAGVYVTVGSNIIVKCGITICVFSANSDVLNVLTAIEYHYFASTFCPTAD